MVVATALAARPHRAARSFGWITIAGVAYGMLGMAAALHSGESEGLRAAVVQLVAVLLAAALGSISASRPGDSSSSPASGGLPMAARGLAWLTLVGLPPTIGFHGKLLIYRALMAAGWNLLAVLAMAGSAAALLPALWAIRSTRPAAARGLRAVVMVVLILCVLALGVYPRAVLLPASGGVGNLPAAGW